MRFRTQLPILVFLGLTLGLIHGAQGVTFSGEVRQSVFIMVIGVLLRFLLKPPEESRKTCLLEALAYNAIMAACAYVGLAIWFLGRST